MLLSVRDLAVRFKTEDGTVHAVNGVSFDLEEAETLGIVGESGCGKSATGLAILRLLPKPYGQIASGRVIFGETDLLQLPEHNMRELRGKDLAMVFQDPMTSLNPVLTIRRQLTEALTAHRRMSLGEATDNAIDLLRTVGIPDPAQTISRYPHQLSGGMRQRVMIAMALALQPQLLIADEPTTALDVTIQAQVLELIRELTRRTRTAVILISHDLGVVASMTQRVGVMYAGFLVETASTAEIFSAPRHPYTLGLLHSIPRLDSDVPGELIPIEGAPPDQYGEPVACPFAPRCAWRLDVCWRHNPDLQPVDPGPSIVTTGPRPTHRVACHNPATKDEARSGHPLRTGFTPAPPPGDLARLAADRAIEA